MCLVFPVQRNTAESMYHLIRRLSISSQERCLQNVDGTYYVNEQVVDETEYLSQQSETLATSLNKGVKDFDTATLEDSESYILAYK